MHIADNDYPMGTAMRMGPGNFPVALGGALGLFGICRRRSSARSCSAPRWSLPRWSGRRCAGKNRVLFLDQTP
jgi:hypothetical protein